jgi:hypothetical protein
MRPLASIVPAALVELLRTAPLSHGKVLFAWRGAVGPAIERVTTVRLEGRVLVVETTGLQWTREIQRSGPVILSRLSALLGGHTVGRLDIRTGAERTPAADTPPAEAPPASTR